MAELELTAEEKEKADEQVKKIEDWLNSRNGKEAVQRASSRSKNAAKKRAEARRVDPKQLEKPVTF
jgi:hypothetical protein